jgi:hypothetical protein
MILNSDVNDRNGRLILGSGVELNAKHLRMFRMWGIAEANIVGIEDQVGNDLHVTDVNPEVLAEIERNLLLLFRNTDLSYPAMGELFRLCLLRKVRNAPR